MAALSHTIRGLKQTHGRDHPDTRKAIEDMAALRARIPRKKVTKALVMPPPAPKPRPPDQPLRRESATPQWKRSPYTPVCRHLQARGACRCEDGAANDALLDSAVVRLSFVPPPRPAAADGRRGCPACLWNEATLRLLSTAETWAGRGAFKARCDEHLGGVFRAWDESLGGFRRGGEDGGGTLSYILAQYHLLSGLCRELCGEAAVAEAEYHAAARRGGPALSLRYFCAEVDPSDDAAARAFPLCLAGDPRIGAVPSKAGGGVTAADLQVPAVLRLLRLLEFAKVAAADHPPDCPAAGMRAELHTCVRHFLRPDVRQLLADHYKQLVEHGVVTFGDRRTARYFAYNDPVARLIMGQYIDYITRLVGFPVKPSYSYMISYRDDSELAPHQDRDQADIVVSILLEQFPACDVWPLCIGLQPQPPRRGDAVKPPAAQSKAVALYPGDALAFRGRQMVHWRERIPPGTETTMLLIHYVPKDFAGSLKQGFND
ncbi:hypothetical protein DIPPA_30055 [Diplonema papillatum]|nr:hypothetical protein DIPPA_30055 [Diplonema papillatum]